MRMRLLVGTVAVCAALVPTAMAADHADGPQATSNSALDITDVLAWTDSGGGKVNLIMDVVPQANKTTSTFSNAGKYVFHLTSWTALAGAPADSSEIICTFDGSTPQKVSCWLVANGATTDYASGDATALTGMASVNGNFTVFTGPRQDPFFFNLDGFKATIQDVVNAVPALMDAGAFNSFGCPSLDSATVTALNTQLSTDPNTGGPANDHFAGFDVLSIVIQLKTSAVTSTGHTVLSVWGSTNE